MSIESLADKIRAKAGDASLPSSVKFDLGDAGVIVIDGSTVSTTDAPADCTITLSKSDLEDLLAGDLSPTAAFMQGKLKVEGDMSVAMQLSQIL